ncbi:MAG: non-canonical purine NTP pyrophosphatase [Oscillospiraceae bacterium]
MILLYGTTNPSKLAAMKQYLQPLKGIELVGLKDMPESPPYVDESGSSPLEYARQKALAYHKFYGGCVFSCDSGLYFDNVPDEVQPGVHVRNVGGRCLSDEEMTEYYRSLAAKYGRLTARYKNAVCLVLPDGRMAESMDNSLSGKPFYIVDKPHPKRAEGFPLDCLSVHVASGEYYYDLPKKLYSEEITMGDGFRRFFENAFRSFNIKGE